MNSYSDCRSQPMRRISELARCAWTACSLLEIWLLKVRNAFASAGWCSIVPERVHAAGSLAEPVARQDEVATVREGTDGVEDLPLPIGRQHGRDTGLRLSLGAQISIELLMHVQDDLLLIRREPGVLESMRVHSFLHARDVAQVLPRNEQHLLGILQVRHMLQMSAAAA